MTKTNKPPALARLGDILQTNGMTEDQLSHLQAFERGETEPKQFEAWFFKQENLEKCLGEELHWQLLSADYGNSEVVGRLRKSLYVVMKQHRECECAIIRDKVSILMEGDGFDKRVFTTLEEVRDHGRDQWWLYATKCMVCSQAWLIASDQRIHDNYYLTRITLEVLEGILSGGSWPSDFQTYEEVLRLGRDSGKFARFFDPQSPALVWATEELLRERPQIKISEIAYLLAVSEDSASQLVKTAKASSSKK